MKNLRFFHLLTLSSTFKDAAGDSIRSIMDSNDSVLQELKHQDLIDEKINEVTPTTFINVKNRQDHFFRSRHDLMGDTIGSVLKCVEIFAVYSFKSMHNLTNYLITQRLNLVLKFFHYRLLTIFFSQVMNCSKSAILIFLKIRISR